MKIIARKIPQVGETFNIRSDSPAKVGNAVSIFFDGVRVALGRVKQDLSQDARYTGEKYVDPRRAEYQEPKVNMAKNVWGVQVEHIFGEEE